jgi:hypothetical protein
MSPRSVKVERPMLARASHRKFLWTACLFYQPATHIDAPRRDARSLYRGLPGNEHERVVRVPVIGAITGGGEGAAIGAAVGAGAGAGSVFIQGRDDLDLMSGTEFRIRASTPR